MQICELNCEFNIEWHSILSGGKPTFPTCEFPSLEWYPRAILIFHSFGSWGILQIQPTKKCWRNVESHLEVDSPTAQHVKKHARSGAFGVNESFSPLVLREEEVN